MEKILWTILALLLLAPCALAEADAFLVGYGEKAIPADLENDGTHYVAGYNNNVVADEVLDDQYAKAVYIEDAEGNHVLLCSVDCVALARSETLAIREALKEHGIDNVHVLSTHDHAGSDTLGLWGEVGRDGKNDAFMERLRKACVEAAIEAYESRQRGQIYFGAIDTKKDSLQEDTRLPAVYDSNLYSFRFEPEDAEGTPLRIVNYATHAESLDGSNTAISADFPAVVAQRLWEEEGSKTVWIAGAIGGLIRTRFVRDDRRENCVVTGEAIAEKVLSIKEETQLSPHLSLKTVEFSLPCENPLFLSMQALGVLDSVSHSALGTTYIDTEMSLLTLGEKNILMVPGELFPELAYGDETIFLPAYPEKTLAPLTELFGEDMLVFGLADDEIGYIVSPDNFLLNEEKPYIERTHDKNGEDHYEETNSLGPETAKYLREAAEKLSLTP